MTLTQAEYGRIGGLKLQASRSPELRKELARTSYLTGAVNAVISRAPELSPEQAARLRAVFGSTAGVGEKL